MTCSYKAALLQESHAAELRVLGCLHLGDDLELFVIPEKDGVVETGGNDLRRVRDLLKRVLNHLVRLEDDDLDDSVRVALHVVGLHALLDFEGFEAVVSLNQ